MPPHKTTNLEKNCGQIFAKGPALTREILDKMHKNRTYILGYEIETKQFWMLSGLVLLFLLSFSGMIAMWFTDAFDNIIFSVSTPSTSAKMAAVGEALTSLSCRNWPSFPTPTATTCG
jgi:hypothetical protein